MELIKTEVVELSYTDAEVKKANIEHQRFIRLGYNVQSYEKEQDKTTYHYIRITDIGR